MLATLTGLSLLLAAGCSGNAEPSDIAAAGSTAALAKPMAERLKALQKCSIDSGRRLGVGPGNYARTLTSKGIVDELRADAELIARDQLAFYERIAPPTSDEGRVANYIGAIGEASLGDAAGTGLKAKAYSAYYESMITGRDCPVDQDILQLINKTQS